MIQKIAKFIRERKEKKIHIKKSEERKILETKVKKGTDFVIQQYGDALRELGAYDRK